MTKEVSNDDFTLRLQTDSEKVEDAVQHSATPIVNRSAKNGTGHGSNRRGGLAGDDVAASIWRCTENATIEVRAKRERRSC
jgi:hypothetical protein